MGNGRDVLAVHPRGRALCSVAATLGCAGYRVLTARVPEQIPAILAEHPVEVIVACGDSGRLRAALAEARRPVPVVLVVPEDGQPPAGDAVVFEPLDGGRLRDVVGSLVEGRVAPAGTSAAMERRAS